MQSNLAKILLAANQGDADAQNTVGHIFTLGQGPRQNIAKGMKWYELAAAQGNAEAKLNIDYLRRCGHGVGVDQNPTQVTDENADKVVYRSLGDIIADTVSANVTAGRDPFDTAHPPSTLHPRKGVTDDEYERWNNLVGDLKDTVAAGDAPAEVTEEYKTLRPRREIGWWWARDEDSYWDGPYETKAEARDEYWNDGGEDDYEDYYNDYRKSLLCDDPQKASGNIEPLLNKNEFKEIHALVEIKGWAEITTDIFRAGNVLERLEECNEEAFYSELPPVWDSDQMRDLELRLADTLYKWLEKNKLWSEFRGLT